MSAEEKMEEQASGMEFVETDEAVDVTKVDRPKQPLFFTKPHPVDAKRHASAGFSGELNLEFAKQTNSIPLVAIECGEAARSYPIVFSLGDYPVPVAVVGMQNKNLFITKEHFWEPHHYVPMYVRKHPFALLQLKEDDQYILCVDEGFDPFVMERADKPLYDEEGNPSDISNQAIEFCGNYQKHYNNTLEVAKALKDADILEQKQMKAQTASGEEVEIGGFHVINEQKLLEMSDDTFLKWRNSGWLNIIYAAMLSQINWKYLAARL